MGFTTYKSRLDTETLKPAVAFCEYKPEHYHVGLVIERDESQHLLDHWGGGFRLSQQNLISDSLNYIWYELNIDESLILPLIENSISIYENNIKIFIPYGFAETTKIFTNNRFCYVGRELDSNEDLSGITCCLFVLSVLASSGINLVALNTWPQDDPTTVDWQKELYPKLAERRTEDERRILYMDIGNKRVTPIELTTAAVIFHSLEPVTRIQVEANSGALLSEYKKFTASLVSQNGQH